MREEDIVHRDTAALGKRCFGNLPNGTTSEWPVTTAACGSTGAIDGIEACCNAGDRCLTNGLCQYSIPPLGSSGYYLAGCTDPLFPAPNCRRTCPSPYQSDVVYVEDLAVWACCGTVDNQRRCSQPMDRVFDAPSPQKLSQAAAVVSNVTAGSGSNGTTTLGMATTHPTPTWSVSAQTPTAGAPTGMLSIGQSESPGGLGSLSYAATLGITIGAAVLMALFIGISALLYYRRKRGRKTQPAKPSLKRSLSKWSIGGRQAIPPCMLVEERGETIPPVPLLPLPSLKEDPGE